MPGDVEEAFAAVRETDFLATVSESPAVRLLLGVRTLGERAVGVVTKRPATAPAPTEPLRLADLGSHGQWVLLGGDPPHEIAFGAAGRFWAGDTSWEELDATDFPTLDRQGLAKIAHLRSGPGVRALAGVASHPRRPRVAVRRSADMRSGGLAPPCPASATGCR